MMRKKKKCSRPPSAVKEPAQPVAVPRLLSLAAQQLVVQTLPPEESRALAVQAGYLSLPNAVRLGPFSGMQESDAALYFLPPDKLFLVYYSDHLIDDSVVRRVRRCCRWVETHPIEVWSSIRDKTQLGPMPLNRAALFVKLVAPGFTSQIQERLILLGVPTVAVEFALGRSGSRECLFYRVHESSPVTSVGRKQDAPRPSDTRVRNDPYAIGPLLFALRTAVSEIGGKASQQGPTVTADKFVRIYGLLVVLAARLAIIAMPPTSDQHGGSAVDKVATHRPTIALELLGKFLRAAFSQKQAFARGGARVRLARSLHTDLRRFSKDAEEFSPGELSLNWQTSVPVTFKSLIEEMIFPEKSTSLSERRDRNPSSLPIGTVEAIGGLVAITEGCDILAGAVVGRRAEMQPTAADLVRVVCGHRLLAELISLANQRIAVAVLSDAASMAQILSSLGGRPDHPRDVARSVAIAKYSCLSSLNNIQTTGRLTREGKRKSEMLDMAMTQEREMARFFRKVL